MDTSLARRAGLVNLWHNVMKISLSWLNTYLDDPVEAHDVERWLTGQGFPIDGRDTSEADPTDVVLDVEVTSNRSDCLSHLGIAREVAAGSGRCVNEPDDNPPQVGQSTTAARDSATRTQILFPVFNEAQDLCPLYTARLIHGVKIGPSPDWLVARLTSVGLRSVNNVVDVTNFVLHELGQPLHAFDLAKLQEKIVIRLAHRGEPFGAIDGSIHELRDDMLVIGDGQEVVAVAGVMGGANTEVTDKTVDILLESAIFDPLAVRRTSRAMKLASDSSHRFERGVDPLGVDRASRRAALLIQQIAGGSLGGEARLGMDPPRPLEVSMDLARCRQLMGIDLTTDRVLELLGKLGLHPRLDPRVDGSASPPHVVWCSVPTYRLDLYREVDLIEEVVRLEGFDSIPVTEKIHIVASPVGREVAARRRLGQVLTAHGYHETITPSLVNAKIGQPFLSAVGRQSVLIDDDRRKAELMLRPSLLPSLLSCRKSNQDVGNTSIRLYETAATWVGGELDAPQATAGTSREDNTQGEGLIETRRLALICDAPDAQQGLRDLRGTIEELVEQLAGLDELGFNPEDSPVYSAAARVTYRERNLGWLGLISSSLLKLFDLQTPVVAAELDIDTILNEYPPSRAVEELPRFPAVERDLSVIVDTHTRWATIRQQVNDADLDRLESLRFLGVYKGKPIPAGKHSVAMRLSFRDPATTLRREQVDEQIAKLLHRLETKLGATLRQ